ncbi:MAG: hypothetical protein ACREMY_14915 [bacterium]
MSEVKDLWSVILQFKRSRSFRVRVGLLGVATATAVFAIAPAIAPVIFIALLTAFAFRTALGGQPMFSARLLDE